MLSPFRSFSRLYDEGYSVSVFPVKIEGDDVYLLLPPDPNAERF